LILGTLFSILGTRIASLKHIKNTLLYTQIQLVLNLQSTYHKPENLQLMLHVQHAGPYFHLRALSCFKLEDRSERFVIDVMQISTTRSRYVH